MAFKIFNLISINLNLKSTILWEFPGSPLVRTLRAFTAEGVGSIPGWGTKFLQIVRCGQNK